MILSRGIRSLTEDFCFTDSIVTDIRWDDNLLDLLVVTWYYWDIQEGKKIARELTIRLKNCRQANFAITKCYDMVHKTELRDYIISWYTITHCTAEEKNGLIEVSIKTIDDDPKWLFAKCEEIWIEGEK